MRRLRSLHGVGPKSTSFLKLLVGLDDVGVDLHVLRFVKEAGVATADPDEVERLLTQAGQRIGLTGEEVDGVIYRHYAAKARPQERTA